MTNQTVSRMCLGGSPAGNTFFRLCTLTLAATLFAGGAVIGFAQEKTEAAPPVAKKAVKKAASPSAEKEVFGYRVHQSLELGGRITNTSGSLPMWNTMVNQSSGMRVLDQSLELRSLDTRKTPLFDTLTTYGTGFGGDSNNIARLKMSKGKAWEFAGSFRRDRNFFDYNQFVNSLLTSYTTATPLLAAEPNTLHFYNTVRRNSDGKLTLFPLARVSAAVGFNHGTHEGPSLITARGIRSNYVNASGTESTVSAGYGTQQVVQWFRNSSNTYSGTLNVKVAPRTTLSYDQIVVSYKGDSSYSMPSSVPAYGVNDLFTVSGATAGIASGTGLIASPGVGVLGGVSTACNSYTIKGTTVTTVATNQYVTNGIMSQYCTAAKANWQVSPVRTVFPTEQIRLSSHYFDRVAINGRLLYAGGTSNIDSFNQMVSGYTNTKPAYTASTKTWNSATLQGQMVGAGVNGRYAHNRHFNVNGDIGAVAEVTKRISVTDSYSVWNSKNRGSNNFSETNWTIPTSALPNLNTTTSASGVVTTTTAGANTEYLNQWNTSNTLSASFIVKPQLKLSAGWRYKTREIGYTQGVGNDWLTFRGNDGLVGFVFDPRRTVRITGNWEITDWHADGDTESPVFTRSAPDHSQHLRVRAAFKPASWINLVVANNLFWAKNDDPLVNHREHNANIGFSAVIQASDKLNFDLNYSYDDVYSVTDDCFAFTVNAIGSTIPNGASNTGACAKAISGSATMYLSHSNYDVPSNYYSASVNYDPTKRVHFNGGTRMNFLAGSAEMLNPYQLPGAVHSHTLMPFADTEFKVAQQWSWHGNWSYNGYGEQGAANYATNGYLTNGLPARNMHGHVVTLGVKYAF